VFSSVKPQQPTAPANTRVHKGGCRATPLKDLKLDIGGFTLVRDAARRAENATLCG